MESEAVDSGRGETERGEPEHGEADGGPVDHASAWAERQARAYSGEEDRPLGAYLLIMTGYSAAVATAATVVRSRGHRLPERFDVRDLLLLVIGTHKIARLLTKDPVTSPVRAPVTRFVGRGGPAEINEEVRGRGFRHGLGELITCPFCVSQWVATTGAFGLVVAPRATRFVLSVFTVVAGSNFLQLAYQTAQQRATSGSSSD